MSAPQDALAALLAAHERAEPRIQNGCSVVDCRCGLSIASAGGDVREMHRVHVEVELVRGGVVVLPADHPLRTGTPSEAMTLRKLLWLRHGCPIVQLYGDDGEMQCGNCGIDFKRLPATKIQETWQRVALAVLQGETKP